VIRCPGKASAEERKSGEQNKVARLGVHPPFLIRRGSDEAAPLARVDGLEPLLSHDTHDRTAGHLSGSAEPRAARPERSPAASDDSRPRPVGAVNQQV